MAKMGLIIPRLLMAIATTFCTCDAMLLAQFPGGYSPPTPQAQPGMPRSGGRSGMLPGANVPRPGMGNRSNTIPTPGNSPYGNSFSNSPSANNRFGTPPNVLPSSVWPANGAGNGNLSPGLQGIRNPFSRNTSPGVAIPGNPAIYGGTTFDPRYVGHVNIRTSMNSGNPFTSRVQNSGAPGHLQQTIDSVLSTNRSLENLLYATDAVRTHESLSSQMRQYRNDAMTMARQQIQTGAGVPMPYVAMAKFSLEDNNMSDFRQYTRELSNRFPTDRHTHMFRGIDLLDQKDWAGAEREFQAARAAGIPEQDLAGFLKLAIDNQKWIWGYALIVGCVIGVWLAGMVLLYLLGRLFSRISLRAITADPNADISRQRTFNRVYRFIIGLAGVYYFLSLPVVTLLSIALPLTLVYAALCLPVISFPVIGIVLAGGIGGVVTATSGLKASLKRTPLPEIDRKISESEAPQLWAMVRQVAGVVGTRPVDEIWMIRSAELAVTERGSFLNRIQDRARRVLILGTAIIDDMDQGAFQSVLAHEYGHFLNRDTAGGDISMRVTDSMDRFVQSVISRGTIRWWDVAVRFLKTYYIMFHQMTFGASRLQEILADRVAVNAFGAEAAERGLRHAIRRDIESVFEVEKKLSDAMLGPDPHRNQHDDDRFTPFERERIANAIEESITLPSSEFDTHPSPKERFALAKRLNHQGVATGSDLPVWNLFADPASVKSEMNKELDDAIEMECKFRKEANKQDIQYLAKLRRDQPDPRLDLQLAQLLAENGNFEKAIACLRRASEVAGPHLSVSLMHANLQRRMGDAAGAIKTLLDGIRECEKLSAHERSELPLFESWCALGRCHEILGSFPDASQAYEKALESGKNSYAIEFVQGKLEMRMGNRNKALKRFDRAAKLCQQAAEPHYYRGKLFLEIGDDSAASDAFAFATQLDPSDKRAFDQLQAMTGVGQVQT